VGFARWEKFGRLTLQELQLAVRLGPKPRATNTSWRQLADADSIVQIDQK
jgi:hypothetical protein